MTLSWTVKESDETNTVFYAYQMTIDYQLRGPGFTIRFRSGNTLDTVNAGGQGSNNINEYLSIVKEEHVKGQSILIAQMYKYRAYGLPRFRLRRFLLQTGRNINGARESLREKNGM